MRIPLPAIVVVTISVLLFLFVPGLKEQPWTALRITGAVLAIAGFGMLVTARKQLGKSFAVTPQAKELVTLGLYSRIRNPIYTFGTVAIAGMLLILQIPKLWILLVVLVAIQIFRAGREARVLEARFGEEYRAYRKQTWF